MKRRSILQLFAALPLGASALKVQAQPLAAPPFELKPITLPPEEEREQDRDFPPTLYDQLRAIYKSYWYKPNDTNTQRAIVYHMSQLCLSYDSHELLEYLIVCNDSNNPPSVVDESNLVVDVFVRMARHPLPDHYHFDKIERLVWVPDASK